MLPLQAQGCLSLLSDDLVLADGVLAVHTPGHTLGHMSVEIRSGSRAGLVLLGDAAVHPLQLADLSHIFSLDADSDAARQTRIRMLERIQARDLIVAACHFPEPGFGRLSIQGGKTVWQPV